MTTYSLRVSFRTQGPIYSIRPVKDHLFHIKFKCVHCGVERKGDSCLSLDSDFLLSKERVHLELECKDCHVAGNVKMIPVVQMFEREDKILRTIVMQFVCNGVAPVAYNPSSSDSSLWNLILLGVGHKKNVLLGEVKKTASGKSYAFHVMSSEFV